MTPPACAENRPFAATAAKVVSVVRWRSGGRGGRGAGPAQR